MLKLRVLAGFLAVLSAPASAEDWWLVSHGEDVAGFIDRDSLRGDNEVRGTLWRVNARADRHSGARSNEVEMRWDCRRNIVTELSTRTLDDDGEEIGHFRAMHSEQAPGRVYRGSLGRAELDFACDKWGHTARFARRAEMPVVPAVRQAYRLHRRLGFKLSDAFALTLTDPASTDYPALFDRLVADHQRSRVAAILGIDGGRAPDEEGWVSEGRFD